MPVKEGDKVKVAYTGTLEDGTVFDSSEGKDPIEFTVGEKQVIKGFDDAVRGMEVGEEKEITLPPAQAYGDPNPQMVQQVPVAQLPKDHEPKEGMMLVVGLPNGQQIPAQITKIEGENATVDLNHPLAGKTLTFKLKVEKIN